LGITRNGKKRKLQKNAGRTVSGQEKEGIHGETEGVGWPLTRINGNNPCRPSMLNLSVKETKERGNVSGENQGGLPQSQGVGGAWKGETVYHQSSSKTDPFAKGRAEKWKKVKWQRLCRSVPKKRGVSDEHEGASTGPHRLLKEDFGGNNHFLRNISRTKSSCAHFQSPKQGTTAYKAR